LPNYAFPESGITLNSIIYRKKSPEGTDEKSYESKSFTYERPSSAGIRELAPNNSFYADGRRVVIDKVDMRLSEPEAWRICDACPHMEREALAKEHLLCPRCGSNLWSDQGRKQELLRIRQVFANTPDWKSRIADERDEREPVFYTTNILVNTEDAAIIDAFQIENPQSPFGFEFLARATMREINFGSPARENKRVRIAGRELERPGFVLCKHCGKVQTHNEEIEHDFGCPARKKDDEQNFIDCVYLYREFSSEAIKILLPVTGYEGSERRLNSFVAALHLGLKHYFGGSAYAIEHLQSTISSEPVADSNLSKQYLVIYDTVPGGTGFLKQLMRSDTLMKVLEKALAVLQTCTCRLDPEKDGCYACLFAYRNSYTMATTSRDTAIDMLSAILAHKDQLKQVKSLKNLSVNGLLDSELEALFLEGLRRLRKKGFSVDLKKTVVNGKPGYFLAIDRQAYEIEPQVEFGPSAGISIHSRVDFVFWPARSTRNRKPVAVFTDGYIFHKNRIGRDIAQRMAIAHSGEFHVWSITWKDVNAQLYPHGQPIADLLHPEESRLGSSSFFQLLDQYGIGVFRKWHTLDNFSLLASFLSRPEEADWQTYAFVQAVSLLDISQARREEGFAQFMEETASVFPAHFTEHLKRHAAENCFTGILLRGPVRLYFWARQEALQVSDPAGVHVFGYMRDDPKTMETDDFEKQWVNFLRLHNLFQFLPVCLFISQDGMDKGYYFALEPPRETDRASSGVDAGQTDSDAEARQEEWEDIFDQTDEEIHPLLEKLRDANRDVPEPGFELFVSGKVAGEAELAWPEKRIAYLREDQMPAADAFLKQGWEVRELADLLPPSRKNMN
jgi:DEAD/DEAH box helicase domain-containing protein